MRQGSSQKASSGEGEGSLPQPYRDPAFSIFAITVPNQVTQLNEKAEGHTQEVSIGQTPK